MVRRVLFYLLIAFVTLSSCKDRVDENDLYTFKGQTIASYIKSQPNMSMFSKLLAHASISQTHLETSMMALLGTVGNYVVFVPENNTVTLYLDSVYGKGKYNIDTFSTEMANQVILNSVIDMGRKSAPSEMDFYDGVFEESTMNNSFLIFQYGNWGDGSILKINYKSRIIKPNLKVDNGYIHIVDRVVEKGPATLSGLIGDTPNLKIFSLLLRKTSWADSLVEYEDRDYRNYTYYNLEATLPDDLLQEYPEHRYSSYTAFVETDEVFQNDWGIPAPITNDSTGALENENEIMAAITEKCKSIYTQAVSEDFTNNKNAVNQFVSYHLLPYKLRYLSLCLRHNFIGCYLYWKFDEQYANMDDFIVSRLNKAVDNEAYYQSMGKPNRLLKIWLKGLSEERRINRLSYHANGVFADYHETSCDYEGVLIREENGIYPNQSVNGYYYPIDHVLVYDDYVKHTVLDTRMRYDFQYCFPELVSDAGKGSLLMKRPFTTRPTNSAQIGTTLLTSNQKTYFPSNFCKDILTTENYLIGGTLGNSVGGSLVFPSDEVTFKLPPVPYAGNWEIRLSRCYGIVQFYLGENTVKINQMKDLGQRDLLWNNGFTLPQEKEYLPFKLDAFQELNDSMTIYENNKLCRVHGVMKMPYSIGLYKRWGEYNYDKHKKEEKMMYCSARNMEDYYNYGIGKVPLKEDANYIYNLCRVIVYRGYMNPDNDYYLRLKKKVGSNKTNNPWLTASLLELVPESVYDNPEQPEDIW